MCLATCAAVKIGLMPATIATRADPSSNSFASIAGVRGMTQISIAGLRWRALWTSGEAG
jgi:hypothetical protein